MGSTITYKKAGVDIDEGERFVRRILPMVRKTYRPEVITDIGSFSALFRFDRNRYKNPVLVSGTDGVGTKLKIAFLMDRHDTVGIDLVAMCVNDILTSGAEPLFFLDYLATDRLRSDKASKIIKGIVQGCKEAGCSLIGGETAEMPGFYAEGEYDLSGFAVGVLDKKRIVDGSKIKDGDVIIGMASSGLHSNGYSLVRRLFIDSEKMDMHAYVPDIGCTLGKELLRPTRIYVKPVLDLKDKIEIKGMAHITGGGIPGNISRILPKGFSAYIMDGSWPVPKIFRMIEKTGKISKKEMKKTFNMGVGYVMVVAVKNSEKALVSLNKSGYPAFIIGNITKGGRGVRYSS
jgi:phosphoribosylformylglycinamidine cyclo-ligase